MPGYYAFSSNCKTLGISTDTLLSYREELTKQEIANISNEIGKRLMKEPYEDVFRSAMQKIQEYPNCGKLAFVLAQILDSYFGIEDVRGKEQYKKEILAIYDRALESEEEEIRQEQLLHCIMNVCELGSMSWHKVILIEYRRNG